MDQSQRSGGESTGPIAVDNPWDAFAGRSIGRWTTSHPQFFFFGNCNRRLVALKVMERALTASSRACWPADRPPARRNRT